MRAAGIEVGGVEYMIDDRDGQRYYYDINALSNFVADAPRVSASIRSRGSSTTSSERSRRRGRRLMRFGYWLPVFGGWLRNVDDERMAATWEYVQTLARRSEEIGFDLTLDRRAEPQRHQGRRGAVARRLVARRRRWPR